MRRMPPRHAALDGQRPKASVDCETDAHRHGAQTQSVSELNSSRLRNVRHAATMQLAAVEARDAKQGGEIPPPTGPFPFIPFVEVTQPVHTGCVVSSHR